MNNKVRLGKRPARNPAARLAKSRWLRFAPDMWRALPVLIGLLALPGVVAARDSLGIFEGWGAFRDPTAPRCYAIAEPVQRSERNAWRAFASIASWPRQNVRGQIHFRLSRQRGSQAPATLGIGDRRFTLAAGTADAWAPDRQTDAAIIAAIRSGTSMSIQTQDSKGRPFADVYALKGAATAIDAAALGCARTG